MKKITDEFIDIQLSCALLFSNFRYLVESVDDSFFFSKLQDLEEENLKLQSKMNSFLLLLHNLKELKESDEEKLEAQHNFDLFLESEGIDLSSN